MGFLDKVKSAAATAKIELEKAGLMDQLRPGESGATPADPAPSGPTLEEELEDAIQHGACDPRLLITLDEVAAIAGHPVALGGPAGPFQSEGLNFDESSVDLVFQGPDDSYRLSVYRSPADDVVWDVEDWFNLSADVDAKAIDGLGDQARSLYDAVYVTQGDWGLGAVVTHERIDESLSKEQAITMLRVALPKLRSWS